MLLNPLNEKATWKVVISLLIIAWAFSLFLWGLQSSNALVSALSLFVLTVNISNLLTNPSIYCENQEDWNKMWKRIKNQKK